MLSQSGRSKKDTPMYLFIWLRRSYISTLRHIPVIPGICFRSRHSHIFPFGNHPFPFPRMLTSSLPFFGSQPYSAKNIFFKKKKEKTKQIQETTYSPPIFKSACSCGAQRSCPFPCYFDTRVISFFEKENFRVPMLPQVSITFWPSSRPFMSA